ncbi:hypothetical protein BGZ49_007633 [Haplosporangium sp. Z 27]|nr:hypothetical protein BGZ49_007633 [Haplosporangium sp. Z 27]
MTGHSSTKGSSLVPRRPTSTIRQHKTQRNRLSSSSMNSLQDKLLDDVNIPSKGDNVNSVTSGSRISQTMPLLYEPPKESKALMNTKDQKNLNQTNQQRMQIQDQKSKAFTPPTMSPSIPSIPTGLPIGSPSRSSHKRKSISSLSANNPDAHRVQGRLVQTILNLPLAHRAPHHGRNSTRSSQVDQPPTTCLDIVQNVFTETQDPTKNFSKVKATFPTDNNTGSRVEAIKDR